LVRGLDLLRLSRFGKIGGSVIEGRKRTAWLAHTSTATAVAIARAKFVRFKGDSCDSTEDVKTDDRVVTLLLYHHALNPLKGPVNTWTRSPSRQLLIEPSIA
jgi:hypothetical protein